MAQGTIKTSTKAKAPKATHSKKQASKVGKRGTKPSIDKVHRKFTAGLTAKTEALLGERAGHLELIGKGKKGKDKKATLGKGGSKKPFAKERPDVSHRMISYALDIPILTRIQPASFLCSQQRLDVSKSDRIPNLDPSEAVRDLLVQ
ncbi:hypothetical protein E4U49_002511 [Claviceps purpurea]|nr:hypothetical protein E4U49_002511 [Claviceps purpurea]